MSKETAQKPAAKKTAPKKKPQKTKAPAAQTGTQVPVLLDLVFNVSKALVVLVGILAMAVSLLTGSPPLAAGLRAGAAMLALGLVLYGVSWMVAQGALEAAAAEHTAKVEEMAQADKAATTLEYEA